MAKDVVNETDDIFSSFKDSEDIGQTDIINIEDSSMLNDSYTAILQLLNTEISGLKIGVWLILFLITFIISFIIWKITNKVKEHNDSELYEKAKNYLNKVGDIERTTLSFGLFTILMFLLFVEASGFSYVFSELMLNDASEKMLEYSMVFGGFIVSVVLMFLTHFSGEELHLNGVLKSIDNEMNSLDKEKFINDKELFPRNKINLETTNNDDNSTTVVIPQYNRMHQKYFDWKGFKTLRRYYVTAFALVFVLSIGIGAMFVRFYVFDKNVDSYQSSILGDKSSYDVETEFLEEKAEGETKVSKPSYFMQQSKLRDKYQRSSKVEAEKKASYVTYVVMMMLFFGIQAVGLIFGNRYSFVGKESKKAYKIIKSYKEMK